MPDVYDELRAVARRRLAMGEVGGTLSTTGLVHEAYLKLADQSVVALKDRGHFFALAAVAMRHVLADRARARMAKKRDGRGRQPSRNKPSKGTKKDMRLKGRGRKPGPKPKARGRKK